MAEAETLHTAQRGGVLTLTLDRPKANAFDLPLVDALVEAFKRAESDASVRCIVLTGAGRVFSAGQDVTALDVKNGYVSFRHHLERTYNRLIVRMRSLDKPVIGAINGAAAGAGLGVALATDVRIAAASARFVFAFTGIGLTADSGTSLMLPLLMGLARANEMAFTNSPLSAEQALDYGLVNRVVPDDQLASAAAELADSLAAGPTRALGLTKRAFFHAMLSSLPAALEYEAHLQEIAGRTEDHREGVKAFLEKRTPSYKGE
ncbi:MAG TPA: enoyl-CoA hydratase-related protein [Anaerolineales bacterium]|nr:enoyl-CoA hydratase-related protein [Anaerolineales bacterium]